MSLPLLCIIYCNHYRLIFCKDLFIFHVKLLFDIITRLNLPHKVMRIHIFQDFRANAEKAKRELDGSVRKGRVIKVRFAPSSATIKVKNLTQWVSNELLAHAFSAFGDLERALVIVDERGKSTGEGIVEYTRKQSAQTAIRKCSENCFFLTA